MRAHSSSKHSGHSNHSNHTNHVAHGAATGGISNGDAPDAMSVGDETEHAAPKTKASEPPAAMKPADESSSKETPSEKIEAAHVAEETLVIPPTFPRPVAVAAALTTGALAFVVVSAFGGAEVLLGAAVAYGIYRLTRKNRTPDPPKPSAA